MSLRPVFPSSLSRPKADGGVPTRRGGAIIPENYIWVFPKGCFVDCEGDWNHLIGPIMTMDEWSWELNSGSQNSGSDTVTEDFYFVDSGTYNLTINNGGCSITSEPLYYQTETCEECEFTHLEIKSIVPNNTPYCSYTVEVNLSNNTGVPLQVTISDVFNNVIITPATFTALPTLSSYLFTVIPIQPFTNGATQWMLQGYLPSGANGYFYCKSSLEVEIPTCDQNKQLPKTDLLATKPEQVIDQIKLIPNPAKESVAIQYALNSTASIVLYDLTGRQLTEHKTTTVSGEWNLNIDSYPVGIYIIVVKQTNGLSKQLKLVIE